MARSGGVQLSLESRYKIVNNLVNIAWYPCRVAESVETPAVDTSLRSGTQGRRIAEQLLRTDIAQGVVAPGQRLVEAELSERYLVTRSSARLAIDALVGDGLVERIANRGARVRSISADEAIAIMECRMVLDGLLCAKAAGLATADDRFLLLRNRDEMRRAVADGELLRYSELIQRHHALVRDSAHQATAVGLVERLQAQIVRLQFQLSLRPRRAQQSLIELDLVVEAIVAGDSAGAERAGRRHFEGVIAALLSESAETPANPRSRELHT